MKRIAISIGVTGLVALLSSTFRCSNDSQRTIVDVATNATYRQAKTVFKGEIDGNDVRLMVGFKDTRYGPILHVPYTCNFELGEKTEILEVTLPDGTQKAYIDSDGNGRLDANSYSFDQVIVEKGNTSIVTTGLDLSSHGYFIISTFGSEISQPIHSESHRCFDRNNCDTTSLAQTRLEQGRQLFNESARDYVDLRGKISAKMTSLK